MSEWTERMRRDLAHIPILPLEALRKLPEATPFDAGVYFLWEADELVYVGKSRHIMDRLARQSQINRYGPLRLSRAQMLPKGRTTALVLGKGPVLERTIDADLEDYERAYIATYEPPMNCVVQNGGT